MLFLLLISFVSGGYLFPEQIRLSWTENEGEMRATWVTFLPVGSKISYRPILCSSIPEPTVWLSTPASSKKFNEGQELIKYQYIHTGVIQGLRPECYYEYYVGNGWFSSKVSVFSGRTPDYSSPFDTSEVKFIVLGDWGTGAQGVYTKKLLDQESRIRDFDAVLHVGDMAYDLNDEEGGIGDRWLRMVEPVASNFAYMTLPGNHETYENFTHYKERFYMPVNDANEGTGYFYSFDMGSAHIVMMNTEVYLHPQWNVTITTQLNWLLSDLAKANSNRELRPWLIVLSHHPLYCSINWNYPLSVNHDCGQVASMLQQELEDIFYENGVDLYIQAHMHNYERHSPIYKNQTVPSEVDGPHFHLGPKAPIYITNGNAGNNEGHNPPSPTPQEWAQFWSNDFGYGRLIVYNNTHLYYEQFSAEQLTEIDYLWVVKTQNNYRQS